MTTKTNITLPPLPQLQVPRIDADIDLMDIKRLAKWAEGIANAHARAAVEADRQDQFRDATQMIGQPVASAEPAVWVAADTLYSAHPTCISSLAYMSQTDHDRGREYVPLAIINHHAAPVAQEPVARVNDEGFIVEMGIPLAPGTKLYTAPQPPTSAQQGGQS